MQIRFSVPLPGPFNASQGVTPIKSAASVAKGASRTIKAGGEFGRETGRQAGEIAQEHGAFAGIMFFLFMLWCVGIPLVLLTLLDAPDPSLMVGGFILYGVLGALLFVLFIVAMVVSAVRS